MSHYFLFVFEAFLEVVDRTGASMKLVTLVYFCFLSDSYGEIVAKKLGLALGILLALLLGKSLFSFFSLLAELIGEGLVSF